MVAPTGPHHVPGSADGPGRMCQRVSAAHCCRVMQSQQLRELFVYEASWGAGDAFLDSAVPPG